MSSSGEAVLLASPPRSNWRETVFRVRVLEKGRAMSEASWAAAGMLSANDPDHPTELAQLASLSIRLLP